MKQASICIDQDVSDYAGANEKPPNLNDLTPAKLVPLLMQFPQCKSIGRVCTSLSLRDLG